jgi:hypothetical protein
VGDFTHIQAKTCEDDFCVSNQSPGAKLGARIMLFFQEQDAAGQMRGKLLEMKSGREPGGPAAED